MRLISVSSNNYVIPCFRPALQYHTNMCAIATAYWLYLLNYFFSLRCWAIDISSAIFAFSRVPHTWNKTQHSYFWLASFILVYTSKFSHWDWWLIYICHWIISAVRLIMACLSIHQWWVLGVLIAKSTAVNMCVDALMWIHIQMSWVNHKEHSYCKHLPNCLPG